MVELAALGLLGRHVGVGAQHHPRLRHHLRRQLARRRLGQRRPPARQSEVQDLGPAAGVDHDVRRFEIPVDDLPPVRLRESVGQRHRQIEEGVDRQAI